jgi:hypothetical protein
LRLAARTDDNQAKIVAALRKLGASVQLLHRVGRGCPDLLVGWRGVNYLFEIKDGQKPPTARPLTLDQMGWHLHWQGRVDIILSIEQVFEILGVSDGN